MSRVKTKATIQVYERNDKDSFKVGETPEITVESHWNYGDRVVLLIDGERYTVIACDLEDAIQKARGR